MDIRLHTTDVGGTGIQPLVLLEVIVGMGTKVWSYIDNTVKLVVFITAPFNILKGAVLSVVTYLLYKRVSPLLHQKSAR